MSEVKLLYVTVGSVDEAERIARTLVEERLVACANLIPGMRSVYRWEGAIEQDEECVLILKTRDELAEKATQRVRGLHSYTCPCVLVVPVQGGAAEFLAWVHEETKDGCDS